MTPPRPRVVLDTNVLVSGVLFKHENEANILRQAQHGDIEVFVSLEILVEFVDVISRPKFRLTTQEISVVLEYLLSFVKITAPKALVGAGVRDPEDAKFLECVRAAKADYLVSGDKDLLTLGRFNGAKILTASRFARKLRTS